MGPRTLYMLSYIQYVLVDVGRLSKVKDRALQDLKMKTIKNHKPTKSTITQSFTKKLCTAGNKMKELFLKRCHILSIWNMHKYIYIYRSRQNLSL